MKVIFFGTDDFAARTLDFLIQKGISVQAVVTRPNKRGGRLLKLLSSSVKELVSSRYPTIPLFEPEKASVDSFASLLQNFHADLFIVGFYGEILKENILKIPPKGCINIHPSLLPKYRGPSPIRTPLINGDKETGVTIIEMVLQMDAGDILGQVKIPIEEEMLFGELKEKLVALTGPLLLEVLEEIKKGKLQKIPQDLNKVSFSRKLVVEDRKIRWENSAEQIHNQIRAFSPTPAAFCFISLKNEQKRLLIRRCKKVENCSFQEKFSPGQTVECGKTGWVVACGEGALHLLEVQLEGKGPLSAQEFIRGIPNDALQKLFSP